ncbi:MAG: hypothetical protein RBQ88_04240 [Desulfobulbus oligotrophicus]|jgi:hypothetical protein|nr:hypothetical protein [Desulfobulbus oligotrophicus]
MAEIKSTMDLVLERAARMGVATPEEMQHEESLKKGMQCTADYLNDAESSLPDILGKQEASQQEAVRKGMLASLLRNLFLPLDEVGTKRIDRAVRGLLELNPHAPDVAAACQELQSIVRQYAQHRQQLYDQLKEQMRMQIEQLLMRKGLSSDGMHIDPTMEPQFKEQWSRLEMDLDRQYGQALEQFKTQLTEWTGA